jgi:hypothetical protein
MARKPSEQVKLNLRFSEALRMRLEKQAARNNRSMNEEIIRRLEESFRHDDFADVLERLSEKMTVKFGDMILKKGQVVTVADVQGRVVKRPKDES